MVCLQAFPLMAKTSFSRLVLGLAVFSLYGIRKIFLCPGTKSLKWEPCTVVLNGFKVVSFKPVP